MQPAIEHRGITTDMIHLSQKSVEMHFDIPLAELILDFFDQLKSRGAVMQPAIEHRGITTDMIHLSQKSVEMHFDIPLAELILDFFDQLKSRTKGYASMDYEFSDYRMSELVKLDILLLAELILDFFDQLKSRTKGYASLDYEFSDYRMSELVKLDILLSGDEVDALSFIVHKDKAYGLARGLCDKLKEIIPRQDHPSPAVRGAHPGCHRQQDHRPLHRQGASQGRSGQVLRRRHLA